MVTIDVLIYFEHVVRELDACMRLRYELEKRGYSVIIASIHFNKYVVLSKYKPSLIVLPFFYKDKDFPVYHFKELYSDVIVVNLHQEQFYNDVTKRLMIPQTDITKSVYHIAWSDVFANDLIEAGINKSLIRITGNPRTDNYFLNSLNGSLTNSDNKKIVFIPTSFSWYFVDSSYFLKNPSTNVNAFLNQRRLTEESARSFFSIIRLLAAKYGDYHFVLRPHPFDPLDAFVGLLKDVMPDKQLENNIEINCDGNVYEWIKKSSLVISWLSTVSLEATLFGKDNIILQPIELPESMQTSFIFKYDYIYRSFEDIDLLFSGMKQIEKNINVIEYAKNSLGVADGCVNERIANFIDGVLKETCIRQTIRILPWTVVWFKSIVIDSLKRIIKRFGLIPIFIKFYSNIQEDLLTVKQIDDIYKKFKMRFL